LRKVVHDRNTSETKIHVELNVDGNGKANIHTGLGFFDHMLDQIARHGKMDLTIQTEGDLAH
jgi:imidazoleglycerol-phosphate dehydratase/histidinol-phosphatase